MNVLGFVPSSSGGGVPTRGAIVVCWYALCAVASGALAATLANVAIGSFVGVFASGPALSLAVGIAAAAYASSELGLLRFPVPSRRWVVPARWVGTSSLRSATVWGLGLGSGALTIVNYGAFWVLTAWLVLLVDPWRAALFGGLYGAAVAAPALLVLGDARSRWMRERPDLVLTMAGSWHYMHGVLLVLSAVMIALRGLGEVRG